MPGCTLSPFLTALSCVHLTVRSELNFLGALSPSISSFCPILALSLRMFRSGIFEGQLSLIHSGSDVFSLPLFLH